MPTLCSERTYETIFCASKLTTNRSRIAIALVMVAAITALGSWLSAHAAAPSLAPGNPGDVVADFALGQVDLNHNMLNFGGAQAMANEGASIQGDAAGLAVDRTSTPNGIYIADRLNSRVLGWSDVTKLVSGAAADIVIGQPDFHSHLCDDGTAAGDMGGVGADSLCGPAGVAVDSSGNLYVADSLNNRVLEYANPLARFRASGQSTGFIAQVVFGQGSAGNNFTGKGSAAGPTGLNGPQGLVLDAAGNLYVADFYNNRVLEYDAPLSNPAAPNVTADLVFGQGAAGNDFTSTIGATTATGLAGASGVAFDSSGNLYVADMGNNRVLEYNSPLANPASPNVTADLVFGQPDFTHRGIGNGTNGLFGPSYVALDDTDNLYVADMANNRVLEYNSPLANPASPNVTADLVFGQGSTGTQFSTANCAVGATGLCSPGGVAIDAIGNLYVVDMINDRALVYNSPLNPNSGEAGAGDVTADLALGQIDLMHNMLNFGGAQALRAGQVPNIHGIAIDRSTTPAGIYISDQGNNRVLGWSDIAKLTNGAPADIVIGQPDFYSYRCDNGTAPGSAGQYSLCAPAGLAVDATGHLYLADLGNNRVLAYASPLASFRAGGQTTGFAAALVIGQGSTGNNFTARACGMGATALCEPQGVALDAAANLYVVDKSNNRVLEYNAPLANPAAPNVTANLVFGQGSSGNNFASNACAVGATGLCDPIGVALDGANNLYVADSHNNRVLEYNAPLANPAAPNVTANLVFGQGSSGTDFTSGGCGQGPSATQLCIPTGVAVDAAGSLYVTDFSNNRALVFLSPLTPPTPTPTPTPTPSQSPSASASPSVSPTGTGTATPTAAPTPVPGSQAGTITAPSPVTVTTTTGQNVSAGSFSYTNTGGAAQQIGAVNVTASDPAALASLTLELLSPSRSVTVTPVTASNVFVFNPPITVAAGGTISFSLTADTAMSMAQLQHRLMLSGLLSGGSRRSPIAPLGAGLLAIGLMLQGLDGRRRRRAVVIGMALLALATVATGCGSSSSRSPVTGLSTGVSVSGALTSPVTLSTVTVTGGTRTASTTQQVTGLGFE
jgi:sugar lactone lactonase YvrE